VSVGRVLLGVNIDHVATVRQARRVDYPDPVEAAKIAERAGADGITAHLREDRRHIQDRDVERCRRELTTKLNLEMAATPEMIAKAIALAPPDVCVVPERREEVTTEGGLAIVPRQDEVARVVRKLGAAGIRVSLFLDPEIGDIEAAAALGAPVVELHTGAYANATSKDARERELDRLRRAAARGHELGLQMNAGHGLTVENVGPIAAVPELVELNIGHSIVARAVLIGMDAAVREMRAALDRARAVR
jgi:pyridoxine 5-phosphate synthase